MLKKKSTVGHRRSTITKSIIILALVSIGLVAFLNVFIRSFTENVMQRYVIPAIHHEKVSHAFLIDSILSSMDNTLGGMAAMFEATDDPAVRQQIVNSYIASVGPVDNIYIIQPGVGFIDKHTTSGLYLSGIIYPDLVAAAQTSTTSVMLGPHLSSISDTMAVTKARYFPDLDGGVVIAASTYLPTVNLAMSEWQGSGFEGDLYIVNADGLIVATSNPNYHDSLLSEGGQPLWFFDQLFSVEVHEMGSYFYQQGLEYLVLGNYRVRQSHNDYYYHYVFASQLDADGWMTILVLPQAVVWDRISEQSRMFTTAVVVIVIGTFIIFFGVVMILLRRLESKSVEEQHLQNILDNSPIAIIILSSTNQNQVIKANQAGVQMFEMSSTDAYITAINNGSLYPLYQPNGRLSTDITKDEVQTAMNMGGSEFEFIHVTRNGRELPSKVTLRRTYLHGVAHVVAYIEDMSPVVNSETDSLTKAKNRHFLSTHITQWQHQVVSGERPLALCLIDIDYFKKINDTYGHGIGDEVLKKLARIVSKRLGKDMWLIRYGGEEFMIVMLGKTEFEAARMAEEIRAAVESATFKIGENLELQVTASFGVSVAKEDETFEQTTERADQALYKAKRNGRNRVEVYSFI